MPRPRPKGCCLVRKAAVLAFCAGPFWASHLRFVVSSTPPCSPAPLWGDPQTFPQTILFAYVPNIHISLPASAPSTSLISRSRTSGDQASTGMYVPTTKSIPGQQTL